MNDSAGLSTARVAVVIGSNRPKRICPEIAAWVLATAQPERSLTFELVDLAEINLPFLDEPEMPARGNYVHEHTKHWSRIVSSYDAFVFVFPQYNWSLPAVLKNALDFLYAEWAGKPAALVTYGTRGGGRGAAAMQQVLQGLHMRNTATNPALNTNPDQLDAGGRFVDIEAALGAFTGDVRAMAADLARLIAAPEVADDQG